MKSVGDNPNMIQALKLKFKGKGPASSKNRMVNLCIDSTTGILIVAMFFFARHLRQLMPGPPPEAIKFSALADAVNSKASTAATALTGMLAKKTAAPASAAGAPETPSAPVPPQNSQAAGQAAPAVLASSATNPIAPFAPVETPGPSNTAADNLAGWVTPKSGDKSAVTNSASAPAGNVSPGNPSLTAAPSPTRTETQPAASMDSPSQTAAAKPAPVSDVNPWLSVFSKGAPLSAVQPAARTVSQPTTASAARQSVPASTSETDSQGSAPQTEEQKLLSAAQSGFGYVLDLAVKNPDTYGFTPSDQIQDCKLGDPIRVYSVSGADQKSYQPGQPLKSILKPTNKWVFPAMLGNQVRFMIPVEEADGECVAGTSSRSLAMVYNKIMNRWPASQGFHPQLIINGSMDNYYFSIPELPEPNLTDTSEMFEFNPTLSPASVILASWQ